MHEFFEDSFDLNKSKEYILSIQVSLDGFSFSVVRDSDQRLLCFKKSELTISSISLLARRFKEWIESEDILQNSFQKIRIIVFSDKFTLIPAKFYDNEHNNQITNTLFENSSKLNMAENRIEKIDASLLFNITEELEITIQEKFNECEIIHPLSFIVEHFSEDTDGKSLVLFFNDKNLYFVLFENGNLLMANNFRINHSNDVIYFVLTALKQLGIATKEIKLFYAGKSPYLSGAQTNLKETFLSAGEIILSGLNVENTISDKLINEHLIQFLQL